MRAYEFQGDRSEELRRQLVEMTAAPARTSARERAAMHQAGFVHAAPGCRRSRAGRAWQS